MHPTSLLKIQSIFDVYLLPRPAGTLLDVGSRSWDGADTYRDLLPPGWSYTGLDLEAGDNVDLVPEHPYLWREIPNASFDACFSGQTFEHAPCFWVTLAEMARVVRPGGIVAVVAPGRGPVHRFPQDCWRFYPDSWSALARYTGLELLETCFEEPDLRVVEPSALWCDSSAVFRRPELDDAAERRFLARLETIAGTARDLTPVTALTTPGPGPAFGEYRRQVRSGLLPALLRRAWRLLDFGRLARKLFVEP
jgi:SAM-dependent methyltransferase